MNLENRLSLFGKKFTEEAGILSLMDDLGHAMARGDMIMMGGGNPAAIPEVNAILQKRLKEIAEDDALFQRIVGIYDPPQGETEFVSALAGLLSRELGWPVGPENIGLTNGSQSAFFILFNMLAGAFPGGGNRKIQLPLAPEYIGYADTGLSSDFFTAAKPSITRLEDHLFKYSVDFDGIRMGDDIGAICVSRPTNPTGNVLTDHEMRTLDQLAKAHGVPFIIDNAYGMPFPSLIFTDARPIWNENVICCMSLSKLGLPAARTGIVVAHEKWIRALSSVNAILNLAPGSFGGLMALELVRSGEIIRMSREIVRPFYERKAMRAVRQLQDELADIPFHIHKPEGAMFLWLWFEGLPVSSLALYERLKARGVVVVSGHYFFPGIEDPAWQHRQECLRVTYSQEDALVEKGLSIIAEEVKRIYAGR